MLLPRQADAAPSGTMLTTRRPRRGPNSTLPPTSANSGSSPPRPTPVPGGKWAPRWRTMSSPALTSWPPNRLTPRRCAAESRPLRDDEAPFLCAMAQSLLRLDAGDADLGQLAAVPDPLAIAGLVLVLEDVDLGALGRRDDLDGHAGLGQGGRVSRDRVAVDEEQHGQLQRGAQVVGEPVHLDEVTDSHLLLAATSADDRVHRRAPCVSCPRHGHTGTRARQIGTLRDCPEYGAPPGGSNQPASPAGSPARS